MVQLDNHKRLAGRTTPSQSGPEALFDDADFSGCCRLADMSIEDLLSHLAAYTGRRDIDIDAAERLPADDCIRELANNDGRRHLNAIVERYSSYVSAIANNVIKRCPRNTLVDREDLVQEGTFGLMRAAVDFRPDKGMKFTSYAYKRIRAAMIDCVRLQSFAPQQTIASAHLIEATITTSSLAGTKMTPEQLIEDLQARSGKNQKYRLIREEAIKLAKTAQLRIAEVIGSKPIEVLGSTRSAPLWEIPECQDFFCYLTRNLDEEQTRLLVEHAIVGRTFEELAPARQMSRSGVHARYVRALGLVSKELKELDPALWNYAFANARRQ